MTADTKRPYDEEHLNAGLMANNAEAYPNVDVYGYNDAIGLHECAELNAHECNQLDSKPEQSHITSAIITTHAPPRETMNETASVIIEHTVTCGTTNNYCSSMIEQ